MGVTPDPDSAGSTLTERQKKWFAAVRTGLERDTGKSLDDWVAIARTCPETRPRARTAWLKDHYGLGINRASLVLSAAFPSGDGWDQPDKLRAALWKTPTEIVILEAVEGVAMALPETIAGQRKGYTAFSRKVQFAALRPLKTGGAMLGLAVAPLNDTRLEPPRNESWSERLKSRLVLASPDAVDASLAALIEQAWADA